MSDPYKRRCKLRTLNEMITCKICRGYLVDATTVTECLHTFCKSCIVKHLEDKNTCPECEVVIHQSYPLGYIAFDRTMQDLVYKIVPGLEQNEYDRERVFYRERGLPCPKDQIIEDENDVKRETERTVEANKNIDFHRFDEQVSICLELKHINAGTPSDDSSSAASSQKSSIFKSSLQRKFIRCSSLATVTHLKKFIAKKLLSSPERHKEIEILCNDKALFKDHTLKFVYISHWRTKYPPLRLQYVAKSDYEADIPDPSHPQII